MLTSFLRLLGGDMPAEIVWTADIHYWLAGQRQRGSAPPDWDTEPGYLRLCRSLGILPYYWYGAFWLAEPVYDATVRVETAQHGAVSTRTWRTPAGELTEELTYLPASCSTGCTRFPVRTEGDLRVLLDLIERRRLEPRALDDYPQRMALWAQHGGLPSIALPRSPLAAFFYEWAGVENAVYLLVDHGPLARRILDLMEEQEAPILEAVCRAAPPLVHFADNLSSDNLGGLYDRYLAGTHRRRLEALHRAGTKCAVHLDGAVTGLLHRLAAIGFDAVEALTPLPAGDVDVAALRALAGDDRVILWGGVPGVLFAPPFTWDDMAAHVGRVLDAWQGTRFVLGVADQVPPDGDIDFCRRIAGLIAER